MNCCVQEQKRKDQKLSYDGDFPEAEVKVEPSLPTTPLAPGGLSKAEARRKIKSQEKRDQMEKIRRRSIEKLVSGGATPPPWKAGAKAVAERKPPDIAARGVVVVQPSCPPPPRLPALPTTPIPVSELPPAAVRSPPAKVMMGGSQLIPALSNLTPIPLRELQLQQQQHQQQAVNSRVIVSSQSQQQQMTTAAAAPSLTTSSPAAAGGLQQSTSSGVARPAAAPQEFISIQVMLFFSILKYCEHLSRRPLLAAQCQHRTETGATSIFCFCFAKAGENKLMVVSC